MVLASVSVAAHRLPASELPTGPRHGGHEDKGLRLACVFVMSFAQASRRGPARREEMIMTRNKAQKTAARHRMAQTGDPYSVARKATQARADSPVVHETPEVQPAVRETPDERYVREAEEAGVPAAELDALRATFLAADRAGQLRQAADQAREWADQAEEAADEAEERAELAQEAAEVAQDWVGEDEQQLAQERADRLRQAADQARERADEAEDAADEAEEAADEAEMRADEAGWADDARDLIAEEDEADGHWHDAWPMMANLPGPPHPPGPPPLPRPPRPARPPRFP
jgi:hypothetical protein